MPSKPVKQAPRSRLLVPSKKSSNTSSHASYIQFALAKHYPRVRCALTFDSPFQLLIATILSAQCTDKQVNRVTGELFGAFSSPEALAQAPIEQVERLIHSTGFYKAKSRHIKNCAKSIVEDHAGQVPSEMAKLVLLSGVARKTANVVLSVAFGIHEGIAVDTHVMRLSQRLGLSTKTTAPEIEKDLMRLFPKRDWGKLSLRLIEHGRRTCMARSPNCSQCFLKTRCPFPRMTKSH